MWSKINRLQLAARLNLALRYKRGVGLDIGLLLNHRRYAREALELCQESGDSGLSDLASQFEDATAAEDAKAHLAIAATTTRAELAELLPALARADRSANVGSRRLSATPH